MGFSAEFAGPLPLPQILQGYEQTCPGAASRVIEMAEREGLHRRSQEEKIIAAQIDSMKRQFLEARIGQIFAFAIALAFLGCGTYTVISGHDLAGSFFSLIGLGGIVTTFIVGREGVEKKFVQDSQGAKQKPENPKQRDQKRKK